MLSKCANPECAEVFRYLHEGKIFRLSPTPEVEATTKLPASLLYERFWLCDACSKRMTLVWGGTRAKLVSLPPRAERKRPFLVLAAPQPIYTDELSKSPRGRVAYAGRDDG